MIKQSDYRFVNLPENEANALAAEQELTVRVVHRDGEDFNITADIRSDRINLSVRDGVVFEASVY